MKYLAAYLLLTIGGNSAPSAKDITALLATVGIEAESARIESLIAQLAGKDVNEVRLGLKSGGFGEIDSRSY
ncbi:hypothetical protein EDD21DRAFT_392203 [Dissophora ornata]|nr:hypothetical protein EDD21DRAFT_392203 [Dissophora ornata]